jgi:hypothetical protein
MGRSVEEIMAGLDREGAYYVDGDETTDLERVAAALVEGREVYRRNWRELYPTRVSVRDKDMERERRIVERFLEWCCWHGISLVGPDPFWDKANHDMFKNIDLYRSVSVHGTPFEKVWCDYIGADFEEHRAKLDRQLSEAVDKALGGSNG